ncbi:uncharacterized protein LOC134180041 [Corticium candelabrum]|uniref:uncharacterized protein LOC134180041 n=1 Tax=Corticium candelabrum TaxID=121492 RepID=UPI002E266F44|nr:uncharacterized protein LOC134180041 [Corticium candelabrum]
MAKRNVRTRKRRHTDTSQPAVTVDVDQEVDYVTRPFFVFSLPGLFLLFFGVIGLATVLISIVTPQEPLVADDPSYTHSESLELQQLLHHTSANGWRVADRREREELDATRCNIERRDANSVTVDEFESLYRFKKPLLLTFPNGAADWTDPDLFQRRKLLDLYSYWSVSSGRLLDIVRSGGSASNSFGEYVEEMLNKRNEISDEPFYIFDRHFFQDSELQHSFRPPHLLANEEGTDRFFLMGTSRSGARFHKHADAWNAVVLGRKRWFLYPPSKTPPGGVWPGYSQIDWLKNIYPTLEGDDKPLECVQEAGEILYLPESYYHGTINIDDTLAIGLQKTEASTPAERIFYNLNQLNVKVLNTEDKNVKKAVQKQIVEKYYQLYTLLPNNAEIWHKLGEALYNDGQYDKGLEFLQKAIDYDPKFVVAYSTLSRCLKQLDDITGSEAAIRKAYKLNPHNFDVVIQYAELTEANGDLDTAASLYEHGIRIKPEDHLYFKLSVILKSLGEHEQAVQMYRKGQLLKEEQLLVQQQYETM